jgi:hypothetical protein
MKRNRNWDNEAKILIAAYAFKVNVFEQIKCLFFNLEFNLPFNYYLSTNKVIPFNGI